MKNLERKLKPVFVERMTSEAQKVNGYDSEMWRTASHSSGEFWNEFNDFVKDAVPFCHNVSFDRPFIEKASRNAGIKRLSCDYHWIGTESLAWPFCKEKMITKFSLASLCEHFGIEPEPLPHRAINGAMKCLEVYRKMINRIHLIVGSHDIEKYFIDPVTGAI
jgi:DNA polymerase III epsilon subunit-like protein